MKEIKVSRSHLSREAASFLSCLATILEMPVADLPNPEPASDPADDEELRAWLGKLGVGLVSVSDPRSFSWPGPWIARVRDAQDGGDRSVVMFGRRPSGVVWDPFGAGEIDTGKIKDGFVLAAEDIALALPPRAAPPLAAGKLEEIWIASRVGHPGRTLQAAQVLVKAGIDGDRYALGRGTFSSQRPGSALTLIEAEVCESFQPPLRPEEHRRNLITRGVSLNGLVGHEFLVGRVRCRGIRLCEPCATMQSYSDRPTLRALVHRGGIRADVLETGEIHIGDRIALREPAPPS